METVVMGKAQNIIDVEGKANFKSCWLYYYYYYYNYSISVAYLIYNSTMFTIYHFHSFLYNCQ